MKKDWTDALIVQSLNVMMESGCIDYANCSVKDMWFDSSRLNLKTKDQVVKLIKKIGILEWSRVIRSYEKL